MKPPTNDREWLNAIQTNRADTARAILAGRADAAKKLRQELTQLEEIDVNLLQVRPDSAR